MFLRILGSVTTLGIIAVLLIVIFTIPDDPAIIRVEAYFSAICDRDVATIHAMLPPILRDVSYSEMLDGLNRLYVEQDLFHRACKPLLLEHEMLDRPLPYHLHHIFSEMKLLPYNFYGGFTRDVFDLVVKQDDTWYVLPGFLHLEEELQKIYQIDQIIELDVPVRDDRQNTLSIVDHIVLELDEVLYIGLVVDVQWSNLDTIDSEVAIGSVVFEPLRFPPEELTDYIGISRADTFVNLTGDTQIVWWYEVDKSLLKQASIDNLYLRIYTWAYSLPGIPTVVSLRGMTRVDTTSAIPVQIMDSVIQQDRIEFVAGIQSIDYPFFFNCFNLTLFISDAKFYPTMCLQTADWTQVNDTYLPAGSPPIRIQILFSVPEIETAQDSMLFYIGGIDNQSLSALLWSGNP